MIMSRSAWSQEDAEAAGWCARLCENLHGAEAFADSDGLDAFISVAMGQSLQGGGGLMVALAQALTMEMTSFKVAIFETLCAAAQWPSLKGRIAGSGVLGVVTATLLSPVAPSANKALMAKLCGLLATDSPEAPMDFVVDVCVFCCVCHCMLVFFSMNTVELVYLAYYLLYRFCCFLLFRAAVLAIELYSR